MPMDVQAVLCLKHSLWYGCALFHDGHVHHVNLSLALS
jgi:hypothetical protein